MKSRRKTMLAVINDLKKRLEHDENLELKTLSEVGDLARMITKFYAMIDELKTRIAKLEEHE